MKALLLIESSLMAVVMAVAEPPAIDWTTILLAIIGLAGTVIAGLMPVVVKKLTAIEEVAGLTHTAVNSNHQAEMKARKVADEKSEKLTEVVLELSKEKAVLQEQANPTEPSKPDDAPGHRDDYQRPERSGLT